MMMTIIKRSFGQQSNNRSNNRSVNRSLTRLCLIVCFVICISILIEPVYSQRRSRATTFRDRAQAIEQSTEPSNDQSNNQSNNQSNDQQIDQLENHSTHKNSRSKRSNFPSKPPTEQSNEQLEQTKNNVPDQAISQSINQSNDQSVELQPVRQSVQLPESQQSEDQPKQSTTQQEPADLPAPSLFDRLTRQSFDDEPKKQSNKQSNTESDDVPGGIKSRNEQSDNQTDDRSNYQKTPIEVPSTPVNRERKSIYQSAKLTKRSHQHSPSEDEPVGTLNDDETVAAPVKQSIMQSIKQSIYPNKQVQDAGRGTIHSGHSDHDPVDQSTDQTDSRSNEQSSYQSNKQLVQQSVDQSTNQFDDQPCLDDESINRIKQQTKTDLKSIMTHYQSIWALEGQSDQSIDRLIDEKSKELISVLKSKKAELAKRACSKKSVKQSSDQSSNNNNEAPSDLLQGGVTPRNERSNDQSNEVQGGAARRLLSLDQSLDEISLIETADDEDDDDRVYVSSIHPYHEPAPSAFTELSERDIQSRHESIEQSIVDSIDQSIDESDDDDFQPGFRATITPTRLSDDTINQSSEREIAEEMTRRIERLKAHRGIVIASILSVGESPDQSNEQSNDRSNKQSNNHVNNQEIGHFVASIKPQHSSPIFEEDEMTQAYKHSSFKQVKAGITAPSFKRSINQSNNPSNNQTPPKVAREWMKPVKENTRSRLTRMMKQNKDE